MQDLADAKNKVRLAGAKKLIRVAENGELQNLVFFHEKPFLNQLFVTQWSDLFVREGTWKNAHSVGYRQ